jgi:hypothetical protein
MQTRQDLPADHPYNVVTRLLQQPVSETSVEPAVARCVVTLERRAPDTIRTAREAGVDIEHLGVSPLFAEARFYEGDETDWVLAPVDPRDEVIVPRREGRDLKRLLEAGIDFPLVYIADEVPKERTADLRAEAANGRREPSLTRATELVGPVPPPAESVVLADRLAHRSTQVAQAARWTAQVAGAAVVGAVTIPATLVVGALSGLATLDPIVIGAMPAASEKPGAPASWYRLVSWDW